MATTNDFGRLLSAARVLTANGDTAAARGLLATAKELSTTSICIKCHKRREKEADALKAAEAELRDGGTANGPAAADEREAVAR